MNASHIPAPPARRLERATVLATFFTQGAMFASWAAHIPEVKTQIGLSDGTLGTVLLATPVGAAVAMLVTGRLLPRLGSRRLIRPFMLGYCVAAVSVGESGSAWSLATALFAWGAFGGSLDVSINTQAVAVERAQQRRLMPLFHGFWSGGALTGAGIGTAAVGLHVSLTSQMLVLSAAALIATLALSHAMVEDREDGERIPAPQRVRLPPAALVLGSIALATMLCEGAVLDWSAVYIRGLRGGAAAVSGLGYAAFAVAMAAVRLSGSRLLDRVAPRRLLPALAILATVVLGLALLSGTVWTAIIAFACLGAGTGLVMPMVFTAAGRITGLAPGAAITGVSACGWVGYMAGPPLIGHLAQLTSMRMALLSMPVLTVTIAAGMFRVAAAGRIGIAV